MELMFSSLKPVREFLQCTKAGFELIDADGEDRVDCNVDLYLRASMGECHSRNIDRSFQMSFGMFGRDVPEVELLDNFPRSLVDRGVCGPWFPVADRDTAFVEELLKHAPRRLRDGLVKARVQQVPFTQ